MARQSAQSRLSKVSNDFFFSPAQSMTAPSDWARPRFIAWCLTPSGRGHVSASEVMTWYRYHHLRPRWLFCGDPDNDGVKRNRRADGKQRNTRGRGGMGGSTDRGLASAGALLLFCFLFTRDGFLPSRGVGAGHRSPARIAWHIPLLLFLSDDNNCPELVRGCAGIARDSWLAVSPGSHSSQWPSCCSQLALSL